MKKNTSPLLFCFLIFLIPLLSCDRSDTFSLPASGILLTETAPAALNDPRIPDTRDALRFLVRNAKKSVWLEAMYFNHDADIPLLRSLTAAAARGVEVLLVIGDTPSSRDQLYRADLDLQTNIKVRWFDIAPYGRRPYGNLHAKYLIVDGKAAVIGSANFSRPALNNNREINAVVTDKTAVARFSEIFQTDFTVAGFDRPVTNRVLFSQSTVRFHTNAAILALESAPWQLNNPEIPDIADCLTNMILLARETIEGEIYLYTSAASNDPWMERALFDAHDRGVIIRLICNRRTYEEKDDLGFYRYPDYRTAVRRARERGIQVRLIDTQKLFPAKEYSTTHSKLLITDGRFVFLGSSNWTSASMRENREVGLFTKDPAVAADASGIFRRDWDFSEE